MKNNNQCLPIVGMCEYGWLATVMEIGGKPYFGYPKMYMEEFDSEQAQFFCMQGQRVSAMAMFEILMWVLENACDGGNYRFVDQACDFLMTNGVTMSPGEIKVDFKIIKLEEGHFAIEGIDCRSIQAKYFISLEDMSDGLYHILYKMNECFGGGMTVNFSFQGEYAEEFSDLLEDRHRSVFFNLNTEL